jgi:hypothetical protein
VRSGELPNAEKEFILVVPDDKNDKYQCSLKTESLIQSRDKMLLTPKRNNDKIVVGSM